MTFRCRLIACALLAAIEPGSAARAQDLAASQARLAESELWRTISEAVDAGAHRFGVAGALVSLVSGQAISSRAFGVADPATQAHIAPDTSRVHIASVTKLFTSVAVLQQVDAGAIDLDADIERYLDGPISRQFSGRGIRMRHLLSHSAGLADRWVGIASWTPDAVPPLTEYLLRRAPVIVEPAGQSPRYSNYGYALAGHIVERVTGQTFGAYVTTSVLRPLGAEHSYVGPRAPDADDLHGFFYRASITPEPYVFEHAVPAGAVHATIGDVARLARAILSARQGTIEAPAVVSPATARAMLSPQSGGARHPAWGLGPYPWAGWADEVWVSGGEVPGWSTRVLFVPRLELGLVVAVNRKDPSLAMSVFDAVLRQVSRKAAPAAASPATVPIDLRGHYRSTLDDPSSFLHFASLFSPSITVERASESAVYSASYANAARARQSWRLTGEGVIVSSDGQIVGTATGDASGRATRLILADAEAGPVAFERVAWWARAEPTLIVMPASAMTSLSCLLWAVYHRRSSTGRAAPLTPVARPSVDTLWWPVVATSLTTLVFLGAFVVGLVQLAVAHDDRFAFGVPVWFVGVLWLPPVLAVAWAWGLWVFAWSLGRPRGLWTRGLLLAHSATVLALIATTMMWNLFGPRL